MSALPNRKLNKTLFGVVCQSHSLVLWTVSCFGLAKTKRNRDSTKKSTQLNCALSQTVSPVCSSFYLSVCLSLCLSVSNPRADPIPIPIQIQIPYSNLQFLHTFISFGAVHSLDKWSVINAALKGAQPSTPRAQPRSLCLSHSAFMLNDT